MVNEATDDTGAKLLGRGADVQLLDGNTYTLRCGFEALLSLERRFGSLGKFHAVVMSRGFHDPKLEHILYGIEAGLAHVKAEGNALAPRFPAERLQTLLDPRRLIDYLDALVIAFWEAMPTVEGTKAPKAQAGTNGSHGAGTTTSRRSSSAARKRPSGV